MSNGELFDGTKYEVYVEPTEFLCYSCEETITDDDPYFDSRQYTDRGELCYGCYEYDLNYASTAVWVRPDDEVVKYYVGDHVIMNEWGDTEFYEGDPILSRGYHSTDGWRGYNETRVEGWEEIKSLTGWTTGDWGDFVGERKRPFNEWSQELCGGKLDPPCEVIITFDPTSNVFSTAVGVWVPEGAHDTFMGWLGEDRAEQLDRALT